MSSRPLAPIGGGLNESTAPGLQPVGTYQRGVNVRGIDPRTGQQVWGAQRAGLSAMPPLPSGHARHIFTASKLVSAREWVDLTLETDAAATPAHVGNAWTANLNESTLAVTRGLDGQAYCLVASGDVVVLNTRGVEVDRIPSAAPRGFSAVPRVFADETGGIFTAASRSEQFEGGAGRVYRWTRDEQGLWSVAWEAVIQGPIETFAYAGGALYVAEGGIAELEEPLLPALTRIGSPLLGGEVAWRETRVAYPIYDIAITQRGQAITSSPARPERAGAGAGDFTARTVDWTPPELPAWPVNAWAWLDALAVNEENEALEEGDPVTLMRDRRFEPTEFDPIDVEAPERVLRSVESDIFEAPTWNPAAFGGVGGVRFTTSTALVSGINSDRDDENAQATIIPGSGRDWTLVMLVQFTEAQEAAAAARTILSQRHDAGTNADWQIIADGLDAYLIENINADRTPDLTTAASARTALLSFQATGPTGTIEAYCNGTLVTATETFAEQRQGGAFDEFAGPFTVLGGGRPHRRNLLRLDGVTINYEIGDDPTDLVSYAELERLRDDNYGRPGAILLVGSVTLGVGELTSIIIDLGTARRVDSFSFWSCSSRRSASSVKVEFSNDNFTNVLLSQTVSVDRGTVAGTRNDYRLQGAGTISYRYVRLTPTAFYDDPQWEVSELGFYDLDIASDVDFEGAEFDFGELIVYGNNQPSERQFLEGYVAHRWGIAHTLDAAHPYFGPGNAPTGTGSIGGDAAAVAATFSSALPVLAKYGTDGTPLAAYTGAGVGLGAVTSEGRVYTLGDPEPGAEAVTQNHGTLLARFEDGPRTLTFQAGFESETRPADRRAPMALGPCESVFAGVKARNGAPTLRRFDGTALTETWSFPVSEARDVVVAGAQIKLDTQGQACGPEYLYVVSGEAGAQARRVDVLGQRVTGERAGRGVTRLAVSSSGDVLRENGASWDVVEAGALPGEIVGSATLNGLTILADGVGYRAYDHANRTLRNFEAAVDGDLPPRCQLIAAYRSRLVLARGDNAFTLYMSAFGKPFDFKRGGEFDTLASAIAGTTASQGNVPEPITALMPFTDDYLYVGTTESLFLLSGDLGDGGRLDQVDKSQGVAFGYAWCYTPNGIYYFSARGGVVRIIPGGASQMVSYGAIQRRLEDIDLEQNRVRLAYNWIDKTVHVYVIPAALGSDVQHFVYEEPLNAWHVDSFGETFANSVTAADSMIGDAPDDRTLILGFADGRMAVWDQYAEDDAGVPIKSSVLVGPLVDSNAGAEVWCSGVYAELSSSQGPVEVGATGSGVADTPGIVRVHKRLEPGRGFGVGTNVSAPAVFVEVRGVGRPWAAHGVRADVEARGAARRIR